MPADSVDSDFLRISISKVVAQLYTMNKIINKISALKVSVGFAFHVTGNRGNGAGSSQTGDALGKALASVSSSSNTDI